MLFLDNFSLDVQNCMDLAVCRMRIVGASLAIVVVAGDLGEVGNIEFEGIWYVNLYL